MELIAHLHGQPVARITAAPGNEITLTYLAEPATPLTMSLPVGPGIHTGVAVSRWLRGLLPEDPAALRELARMAGVGADDTLGILATFGLDCAGAVQFAPPGQSVKLPRLREPASSGTIEARLAEFDTREASWLMPGEHWSLGGMQQKFTLLRENSAWFFPGGAQPSTHIVKPGVRGLRAQAMLEHVSMRVAKSLGVDTADTQFLDFGSERAVVIERFDRARVNGKVVRIHHEDLCQAMGVAEKYEAQGGPGVHDIAEFLRDHSATKRQELRNITRFADQVIINVLLAAPDAHARNFSVLLEANDGRTGGVTLAPMYDAATGLPYDRATLPAELSMRLGDTFKIAEITPASWATFADDVGIPGDSIVRRVRSLADRLPAAVATALNVVDDWSGYDEDVAQAKERLTERLPAHLDAVVP